MKTTTLLRGCALAAGMLIAALPAHATDVDGADDCARDTTVDFGDAPEDVDAYVGVPGHFPTCIEDGPAGDQELAPGCPAISTPPGPTGYVKHVQYAPPFGPGNFWLGCYEDAAGLPMGIDSEEDGKVNTPPVGVSVCKSTVTTDCVSPAGPGWDQDECFLGGGTDAGLTVAGDLIICEFATVEFETYNCGPARLCYLNVLLDMNHDGDWNDTFLCPGTMCAYEWAVKNSPLFMPVGCFAQTSPPFLVGPNAEPGWMRITISEEFVTDDFPWAGSVTAGDDVLTGGETEDYPRAILAATPVERSTWGRLKAMYR